MNCTGVAGGSGAGEDGAYGETQDTGSVCAGDPRTNSSDGRGAGRGACLAMGRGPVDRRKDGLPWCNAAATNLNPAAKARSSRPAAVAASAARTVVRGRRDKHALPARQRWVRRLNAPPGRCATARPRPQRRSVPRRVHPALRAAAVPARWHPLLPVRRLSDHTSFNVGRVDHNHCSIMPPKQLARRSASSRSLG